MRTSHLDPPSRRQSFGALLALLIACGDSPADPDEREVGDVDLDALFAPPLPSEIAAVLADWQSRDVSSRDYRLEQSTAVVIGGGLQATARIVSHIVDGNRHYGAIVVPADAAPSSLPVIVYAHGGDSGVSVEELVLATSFFGSQAAGFVFVIPSFRSEVLSWGQVSWRSEGEASPWDGDVDDALAVLNVALETSAAADPSRIGVLGFSRGGGVGLLMGVRDARIDGVVEFFGPTDFYDGYVRGIVEEALRGSLRDLPGLRVLNDRYIQPLRTGAVTITQTRAQLLLRSAVYFAERLQGVQVHHGTADVVVDVSQARSLIDRLDQLGRSAPEFEFFIYPGGQHSVFTLQGSAGRTVSYFSRLGTVTEPTTPAMRAMR